MGMKSLNQAIVRIVFNIPIAEEKRALNNVLFFYKTLYNILAYTLIDQKP